MKKFLKIFGLLFLLLVVGLVIFGIAMNEEKPKTLSGQEAELLAEKMLQALDIDAWNATNYISWQFPGGHHYVWDKASNQVEVKWGNKTVIIPTQNHMSGKAWVDGEPSNEKGLLETAWTYFCNDSFWLIAHYKVMDPGTDRSAHLFEDGSLGLMVTYKSGGTTPGDSYLWKLDDNYRPTSYKMWVQILPIGGLEATWDGWITLSSGAQVSTIHDMGIITTDLKPVKGASTLSEIGLSEDYFSSRM